MRPPQLSYKKSNRKKKNPPVSHASEMTESAGRNTPYPSSLVLGKESSYYKLWAWSRANKTKTQILWWLFILYNKTHPLLPFSKPLISKRRVAVTQERVPVHCRAQLHNRQFRDANQLSIEKTGVPVRAPQSKGKTTHTFHTHIESHPWKVMNKS